MQQDQKVREYVSLFLGWKNCLHRDKLIRVEHVGCFSKVTSWRVRHDQCGEILWNFRIFEIVAFVCNTYKLWCGMDCRIKLIIVDLKKCFCECYQHNVTMCEKNCEGISAE
jgi:hypothetical protein